MTDLERVRLREENARLREEKVNLEVLLNANYARAKELEAQRDTLLAALREIIEQSEIDTWYTEIAEGAIAEVQGEK